MVITASSLVGQAYGTPRLRLGDNVSLKCLKYINSVKKQTFLSRCSTYRCDKKSFSAFIVYRSPPMGSVNKTDL